MTTLVRYSKEELKKIEQAAEEFSTPDGNVKWKELFDKYEFPGREQSNIKIKYKQILRKKGDKKANGKKRVRSGFNGSGAFEKYREEQLKKLKANEPDLDEVGREEKIKSSWKAMTPSKKSIYTAMATAVSVSKRRKPDGSNAKKQRKKQELKLFADAATTGLVLPFNKVKKVSRNSVERTISKEGIAVVSKATEMFILWLAEKSAKISGQNRKLSIDDMIMASKSHEESRFLRVALFNGYIPEGM
mmetsp:Transcript_22235/g.31053  ORF Transcript_22235/g.31053 Transcript_22235/m.31053 type:complete len:246 (+) Transcript_22235:405-1142(+)|eukprot:CAMPEP_0184478560 /NCGR_PEP_ID=MMETSP0113_2-20130426/557_1 /TAXON_ID=91329 /ORGANISM="Norrisiella sphaerica, Strain BC52" /LENGTH=245 /DNA_ID=CAMNT_0026856401 /DNA_START=327 /DNA_END=1064 /DNA_ORIENTATION=+